MHNDHLTHETLKICGWRADECFSTPNEKKLALRIKSKIQWVLAMARKHRRRCLFYVYFLAAYHFRFDECINKTNQGYACTASNHNRQ
jgi:hypothetical protein